jgi:hypothetical protein
MLGQHKRYKATAGYDPTHSILKLNEGVRRQMYTHSVSILLPNFDRRELAPVPWLLDRDSPEASIVVVKIGEQTRA